MRNLILVVLLLFAATLVEGQDKKVSVHLTVDCNDTVGSDTASALRERIRGSNGYVLAPESTKGHSGFEIVLTCIGIPGHEATASAVSYIFDAFLPDEARYFVTPGIGIVGKDAVDGEARTLFSQFDNYVSDVQRKQSK